MLYQIDMKREIQQLLNVSYLIIIENEKKQIHFFSNNKEDKIVEKW